MSKKKKTESEESEEYLKYIIKKVIVHAEPGSTVILQSGRPKDPPPHNP